ncbi:MAG: FKBP-type peptidyl-prolyl cis-trans isomerase [Ancrocorticia sp.]|uniref:FKBP-type peptidyl-prolyl cis-trans isomerase n=1 Tax=Ancrocorticia sp. TaxID=2593684 RepID=UPI003F8ECA1F
MRPRITAAVLAVGLALTLSACNSDDTDGSPSEGATGSVSENPSESPTEAPEVVESDEGMPTATEDEDGNAVLEFPESDAPADIQVSVVEEGEGEEIVPESIVKVDYTGQVWGSDEPFDSSFPAGNSAGFPLSNLVSGWTYALDGHHAGGKYIISIPTDYGYGPQGGNSAAGIGPDDTIAFYIEVHDSWSSASTGEADATVETPADELPVTLDAEAGAPVTDIAVNDGEKAPTELEATVITRGSGEEVTGEGATLFMNYAAISWDGEVSENSWTGEPEDFQGAQQIVLGSGTVFDSLDGVPVGSRVLLTIPESDGGEQQVSSPAMVAVVDILGFLPAAQ